MALLALLPLHPKPASMTLCAGCNYPIPSWQHQGACKPVAEKVPPIPEKLERAAREWVRKKREGITPKLTPRSEVLRGLSPDSVNSTVTNPVTNSRGRPRVTNPSPAALKQRERRAKRKRDQ